MRRTTSNAVLAALAELDDHRMQHRFCEYAADRAGIDQLRIPGEEEPRAG